MLFLVHDDDGRITQANKVYSPDGYADQLRDLGLKHVVLQRDGIIPIDDFFIQAGAVSPRPVMKLRLIKDRIATGDNDAAYIRGIPHGARFTIVVDGHESVPLLDDIINDTVMEFSAPAPGTYKITFEKFPYLARTLKITAI